MSELRFKSSQNRREEGICRRSNSECIICKDCAGDIACQQGHAVCKACMNQYLCHNIFPRLYYLKKTGFQVPCPDSECEASSEERIVSSTVSAKGRGTFDLMQCWAVMEDQQRKRFLSLIQEPSGSTEESPKEFRPSSSLDSKPHETPGTHTCDRERESATHRQCVKEAIFEILTLKCPHCMTTCDPSPDGCRYYYIFLYAPSQIHTHFFQSSIRSPQNKNFFSFLCIKHIHAWIECLLQYFFFVVFVCRFQLHMSEKNTNRPCMTNLYSHESQTPYLSTCLLFYIYIHTHTHTLTHIHSIIQNTQAPSCASTAVGSTVMHALRGF